jgi:hypothetical protein
MASKLCFHIQHRGAHISRSRYISSSVLTVPCFITMPSRGIFFLLLSFYAAMPTSLCYALHTLFMKLSSSIPNSTYPQARKINMWNSWAPSPFPHPPVFHLFVFRLRQKQKLPWARMRVSIRHGRRANVGTGLYIYASYRISEKRQGLANLSVTVRAEKLNIIKFVSSTAYDAINSVWIMYD